LLVADPEVTEPCSSDTAEECEAGSGTGSEPEGIGTGNDPEGIGMGDCLRIRVGAVDDAWGVPEINDALGALLTVVVTKPTLGVVGGGDDEDVEDFASEESALGTRPLAAPTGLGSPCSSCWVICSTICCMVWVDSVP